MISITQIDKMLFTGNEKIVPNNKNVTGNFVQHFLKKYFELSARLY